MGRWQLPKIPTAPFCPSEIEGTVSVPEGANTWQRFLAFLGPGYLVAVGYMDPGNWATDIAAGSQFGYGLLSVILISNFIAVLLQTLSVRLGLATGLDLAQMCRAQFPARLNFVLWVFAEIAIVATDLAELLGSALALKLLFGLPLAWGVCLTALDIVVVLALQSRGFRWLEAMIIGLIATIGLCFIAEIVLAKPDWGAVAAGYLPQLSIVENPGKLYLAIGILGATVMPHNLYLHSAIVQTRAWDKDKREAVRFATVDSTIALFAALLVNSAILIVAAASFHFRGYQQVAEIQDAYRLLAPLLGTGAASFLFGLALLASGQSSTFTGTLAGQIVMEGFLDLRIPCWLRRLLTRALAIIPGLCGILIFGEGSIGKMLVLSQVILSLQLPFAVFPLLLFTANPALMGRFTSPAWIQAFAWMAGFAIAGLNAWLLIQILFVSNPAV
ncbi:Nramp family divalent metal transporter [Gloeobacter kilaueensis]|uniref:Divalent metal cation transporter MntH n=1 Tax=Gloeobacter kilaueensis (strain ATCC BAA-2537 / CCAP 1431/1 / ULC 316 / JS1) TaxID=1183438 RepID=U5QCA6_GLOK1|nr:Nramp family divalent metal transporter [Gloeobacter kilaueensis]AGY56547.1 manganese transport protein MntH [Gloeobacter kilaueensis JS1]